LVPAPRSAHLDPGAHHPRDEHPPTDRRSDPGGHAARPESPKRDKRALSVRLIWLADNQGRVRARYVPVATGQYGRPRSVADRRHAIPPLNELPVHYGAAAKTSQADSASRSATFGECTSPLLVAPGPLRDRSRPVRVIW